MRLCATWIVVSVVMTTAVAVARGDDEPSRSPPAEQPDYEAAKLHYQNAESAMAAEDYALAAREYLVAYRITKDPVLFFKLGTANQLLGKCDLSEGYFNRYIKEADPSDEFHDDAMDRIAACEMEEEPEPPQTPPAVPAAGEGPAPKVKGEAKPEVVQPKLTVREEVPEFLEGGVSWQKTAAWTSVGFGVALLSSGAVLGFSARSRSEDMENLLKYRDSSGKPAAFEGAVAKRYRTLDSERKRFKTQSIIAFGAAGVSVASAVLFFVLDASAQGDDKVSFRVGTPQEGHGFTASTSWAF